MNEHLSDAELDELLAAFALDAPEPDEARAVERYVQRDARARLLVDADREIASLLVDGAAAAPEAGLSRLLEALDTAPELSLASGLADGSGSDVQRKRWVGAGLLAAAAAVLVVALTAQMARQQSELREQRQELAALDERLNDSDMNILAARAAQDPTNRLTVLTSEDEHMVATAVVGADGHGYLLADALPDLPDGQSYQLWGLIDDHMVSLGLLRGPGVVGFHVDAPMDGYALTQEEVGGAPAPTSAPLVVGLSEAR